MDDQGDELLISVRAKNVGFRELLGVLAFEASAASGRSIEIVGLDKLARNPRIDVFLVDRTWSDSLRWVAGAAGLAVVLSARRIEVQEALPNFPTASELRMRSLLAYRQILSQYPETPSAPDYLIETGKLALALGPDFGTSALESFETLIKDHPQSHHLWDAMMRSAAVYGSLGEWDKAAVRYHEVADSATAHEFHVPARLQLAKALCEIGERASNPLVKEENGTKAVLTLQALDRFYPVEQPREQRTRAILMGRALALTSEPVHALRALDIAAEQSPLGRNDEEILAVRAKALSRAGRHGDASTAWLAASRQVSGKRLEDCLIFAADEALKGGHEIAVLAIYRQARSLGFSNRLESYALEARLRLGIANEVDGFSLRQQLRRALQLHRIGQSAEAVRALRSIYLRRSELEPSQRLELALGFAKALYAEELPKEAIETLRVIAGETKSAMDKRQIYTLGAEIHEAQGNFEAAILALEGKL